MKTIRIKQVRKDWEDYEEFGAKRIQEALAAEGYSATVEQCRELWLKYSDSMAAGWMQIPESSAEVLSCVDTFFDAEEGE